MEDKELQDNSRFIKKLAADYNFLDYGYRIIIGEKKVVKKCICIRLWEWFKKLFILKNYGNNQ